MDPKNAQGGDVSKETIKLSLINCIDEQAAMKEKFLDAEHKDFEAYTEVNNLIISSIKAKLECLFDITENNSVDK